MGEGLEEGRVPTPGSLRLWVPGASPKSPTHPSYVDRLSHTSDLDLLDARPLHLQHGQSNAVVDQTVASLRQAAELLKNEARQRLVVACWDAQVKLLVDIFDT